MIAARNRAFIEGSGWPILAATVISRASFENSFDFWASCRPLRCMMFLNWECPAMRYLSGIVREMWEARRYRPATGQNQRLIRPTHRIDASHRRGNLTFPRERGEMIH